MGPPYLKTQYNAMQCRHWRFGLGDKRWLVETIYPPLLEVLIMITIRDSTSFHFTVFTHAKMSPNSSHLSLNSLTLPQLLHVTHHPLTHPQCNYKIFFTFPLYLTFLNLKIVASLSFT